MNTPSQAQVRRAIAEAQTIVVKVGSSSLTKPSGHLDPERLNALVAALARVRLMGGRVVLVSSGAIAAGFGSLGFDSRPTDVADQQACAAVGQGLLMAQYENAFSQYGLRVGQILITVSDTIAPQQYRNVRRTLDRLLDLGAVPIINENDSLASNEIRFGDNDRLSALIANIVVADALVLLTDVDALYTAPPSEPGSRRISYVPNVEDALAKVQVGGTGSNVGTGGMVTKMEAARVAAVSGIPPRLPSAAKPGPALMGDPLGAPLAPPNDRGALTPPLAGVSGHPPRTPVARTGASTSGTGHSRSAHLRGKRRPGHDGRPSRHRIRPHQRPWIITPPMDRVRSTPARHARGRCRRFQCGTRRGRQPACRRRTRSAGRFCRRRRGVDRR